MTDRLEPFLRDPEQAGRPGSPGEQDGDDQQPERPDEQDGAWPDGSLCMPRPGIVGRGT